MVRKPEARRRLLVGLTGIFGSGKSTVAELLRTKGARVIDCDRLAREPFSKKRNPALFRRIAGLFGGKAALRSKIAEIVFRDPRKRKRLEKLIHPHVRKRIQEELASMKNGVAVIEVPLLFEAGFDRLVDVTVTVDAAKGNILKRLAGKGFNPDQIRLRWGSQLPSEVKRKRSDFVVVNSGSKQALQAAVNRLWRRLAQLN